MDINVDLMDAARSMLSTHLLGTHTVGVAVGDALVTWIPTMTGNGYQMARCIYLQYMMLYLSMICIYIYHN